MIHISRIPFARMALTLVFAGSLFACGSKPDPDAPKPADAGAAAETVTAAQETVKNPLALLSACELDMDEPNSHEWSTKWDPAFNRDMTANPSGVRSAHWASEEELQYAQQANQAFPLELSCGSGPSAEYPVTIDMVAVDSSITDIPLQGGTYPIAPRSLTGKNNPGEIVVANLQFNGASFEGRSGSVTLSRFDSQGAAGSFVINGREVGGENRPISIEGTFDMPCRLARLQNGCKSDKAERE